MKVAGTVDRLFEKPWQGRNGRTITLHSFTLKDNRKFFRTGEQKPNFRETDYVEFEADDKGNASDVTVRRDSPKAEVTPTDTRSDRQSLVGTGGTAGKTVSKDSYWSDREQRDINKELRYTEVVEPRITYSSSQSDAVKLVATALQYELLSFGNANKSAKLGLLLDYVDQVTLRFAQQRMNAADILSGKEEEPEQEDSGEKSSGDSSLDD